MGRQVLHTGPLGTASVMKVVTNYLAGVQLISTGEAFMVSKKAGVDLGVAYEAIRISSGNSFVHETVGLLILNGSYNITFTLDQLITCDGYYYNIWDSAFRCKLTETCVTL